MSCRERVEEIIARLERAIGEYAGWLYFKGQMGGDPVPPRECSECDYRKLYDEIRALCGEERVTEYLCLKVDELREIVRGRVEDVVSRCWEKYASGVCHHLPFISHFGLDRLVDEFRKLNVSSATIRTLDNKLAIVDIVNEDATRVTVCIGVRP